MNIPDRVVAETRLYFARPLREDDPNAEDKAYEAAVQEELDQKDDG